MAASPSNRGSLPPDEAPWQVPALLAVSAPLSVIVALEATQSVLVAFVTYHVVFCLVVPLAVDRVRGRSLAGSLDQWGLRGPSREGWAAGILTGLAMASVILAPAITVGQRLLARVPLGATLSGWGVPLTAELPLFLYMLVFNSGAEELFWRGYLQTELVSRLGVRLGVAIVALAFTSYHLYTLAQLLVDWRWAVLGTVGVFLAALVWSMLRDRYDSVLPAVLSHAGATAGYMLVFVLLI